MASTMGASRDLTRTFVEWRAMREKPLAGRTFGGYERGSSQEHSPMSSSRAALPPVWVDVVEKVETDVATLERALKSLKEAHRARLMVSFDESREAELDREIERQSQNATQLFRACEKTLKRVATFGGDAADDSERKVRANVQRSVAVRIQALNTEFRRAQKDYVVRLKSQKEGSAGGGFDFLSASSRNDTGVAFNEQQMSAVVDIEHLVEERDQEIRKIAESIQELSGIFKELAVLVIDQGTILDRIDFNMEQVAEHTRRGVVEIEKAEQYQKAARPRICIALLLFLITIMMIALILKHHPSGGGKGKKGK
jgi:syntaxin 16